MLDIRRLRETPETVKTLLALRGPGIAEMIDGVLSADIERRSNETRWQHLQAERKRLSKEIGGLRAKKEDSAALEEESKKLGAEMDSIQAASAAAGRSDASAIRRMPRPPPPGGGRNPAPACCQFGPSSSYFFRFSASLRTS